MEAKWQKQSRFNTFDCPKVSVTMEIVSKYPQENHVIVTSVNNTLVRYVNLNPTITP